MTRRSDTRRDRREWSGQTLPLFAIIVPGVLALMALGMDGAQIFVERRDAQSAADLAALSGVRELPDSATNAKSIAKTVGAANGYLQSQIIPVSPFNGDSSKIEVTVNSSVTTFFMPILAFFVGGDHSTVAVSARAVAEQTQAVSSGGGFAIFALESCPSGEKSVDISGSDSDIVGEVHSNSDVYFSGSDNTVTGPTTHTCGSPSFHNGGGGNTFNPAPAADSFRPDPINLVRSDFTCDFIAPSTGDWDLSSDGSWWVGGSKDSKTLRAGTFCARGSSGFIKLSDSDIVVEEVVSGSGGVSFVAQCCIDISGSNFDLHPHEHDVLLFSEGNSDVAIKMAGSSGDWLGAIYAPNGTAEVSGSGNINLIGGIVADRVKLNGSSINLDGGSGPSVSGPQTIALIE